MIVKWKGLLLEVEEIEQKDYMVRISGRSIDKSGRVSVLQNLLIDPKEIKPLKISPREKAILQKALKHPRPSSSKIESRPTYWKIWFKPNKLLSLGDVEFHSDKGQVIAHEKNILYVKTEPPKWRPEKIWAVLKIDGEFWRIPLEIVSLRWIEASEIPKPKKKGKGRGSSYGK